MSRHAETLREARKIVADEFETLWRPAPHVGPRADRPQTALARADAHAAAKKTAFTWLAAQLGTRPLSSFDDIGDVETLKRAWPLIWNATIADVRRWADADEALLEAA